MTQIDVVLLIDWPWLVKTSKRDHTMLSSHLEMGLDPFLAEERISSVDKQKSKSSN